MDYKGDQVIYSFDAHMKAAHRVPTGVKLRMETHDCFYQQMLEDGACLENLNMAYLNPATGPFYIEGAQTGDILKVEILAIEVANRGVASIIPGMGFLAEKNTQETHLTIPVDAGVAKLFGLQIPIKPMIGVIGVAPKSGAVATNTPGAHGGNMDTRDITAGSTLYLPVSQDGALFALGDCHALMGDGEIGVTGLEIAARVTLRFDVIKSKKLPWPLLETKDATMLLVSEETIDEALRRGLEETLNLLKRGLGLTWNEATILASLTVDARISQLVDPLITVRFPIKKEILSTEKILESL